MEIRDTLKDIPYTTIDNSSTDGDNIFLRNCPFSLSYSSQSNFLKREIASIATVLWTENVI